VDLLRYLLSGLFVISVAVGLLLLVRAETSGRDREWGAAQATLASRPRTWLTCAGFLFVTIVILTILFPVGP
jgi:hypothetical protein